MIIYNVMVMNEAYVIRSFKWKKDAIKYLKELGLKKLQDDFYGESKEDIDEACAYYIGENRLFE